VHPSGFGGQTRRLSIGEGWRGEAQQVVVVFPPGPQTERLEVGEGHDDRHSTADTGPQPQIFGHLCQVDDALVAAA